MQNKRSPQQKWGTSPTPLARYDRISPINRVSPATLSCRLCPGVGRKALVMNSILCCAKNSNSSSNLLISSPKRPLLLDLYCCAGGAAYGYYQAGFDVIGVDIVPQKNYPFRMCQGDALAVLDMLLEGQPLRIDDEAYYLSDFQGIHSSPECKGYTNCNLSPKEQYERQITPVRARLQATGLPYIIENVVGAKKELRASLLLCGSMFGLPMQRHRLFELGGTDAWIRPPKPCDHRKASINVYGHSVWDSSIEGTRRRDGRKRPDSVPIDIGRAAMGINWMTIEELAEAIPPAYTAHIGSQLLAAIGMEVQG